jgi:phosphohistidine swiveling domain-containing protein
MKKLKAVMKEQKSLTSRSAAVGVDTKTVPLMLQTVIAAKQRIPAAWHCRHIASS